MFDDEEIIPETEMLSNDDAISNTSNDIYAADVEAAQPPNPTQMETRNLILQRARVKVHMHRPRLYATRFGLQ